MLFLVTHTHTWETCPYHDADMAQATIGAALSAADESDARLVGAWSDPPAHKIFMVIEADSVEQIEAVLAPVIDIGTAETRPVVDAAALLERISG